MKVLISGGGTGGHIYPAVSIAHEIKKNNPDAEILYVGTKKGMEADIVPKEGLNFETIRVQGFSRKISINTVKSIIMLIKGINDARKVIKKYKPDLVIGTGGYVCGPVVYIAAKKKIPTLIHEQNAFPGATNRILSKYVDLVACGFEEARKVFHTEEKIRVTGNPIRAEVMSHKREDVRSELGLGDKKVILSFGGSGGQRSLNDAMLNLIEHYKDDKDIKIYHVTGKRFFETFKDKLKEAGLDEVPDNLDFMEYCYDIPKYLSASDLVITSAGAITIAEITALGIPGILIPKAYTTENHQEYNARALEEKGAAKVILERELDKIDLSAEVDKIINDENQLSSMRKSSLSIGIRDAANRIYIALKEIVKI